MTKHSLCVFSTFVAFAAQSCLLAAEQQPAVPAMTASRPLHEGVLEVEAGEQWSTSVAVQDMGEDECPVLSLRARAEAGGGCNYVLQVRIDDAPLTGSVLRRRLINKLPWFDPPGTKYHFPWYGDQQEAWMTMFSSRFDGNWGGTGRDCEFVFDLSGLVASGQSIRLGIAHIFPRLPQAIKRERAPLVVDRLVLGAMSKSDVERLRGCVEARDSMSPVPVRPTLPKDATPGKRPYELVWSGRQESPRAQVPFDDLAGWTASLSGGMEASLEASVEQLLWRKQLAKLSYTGGSGPVTIVLRPPKPVLIQQPFDAADMWIYAAIDRRKDRHPQFTAHLQDNRGREFAIDLGFVRNSYWVRLHGVASKQMRALGKWPMRFVGLSLALRPPEQGNRALYLESMAFYQRNRSPFTRNTRPAQPSFPTSDDGMLPTPPPGARVRVAADDQGAIFTSKTTDGTLRFRVEPDQGTLDGVRARWNNGPWVQPMARGKVKLDLDAADALKPALVVSSRLVGERLVVRWRKGVEWQATYSLRGRTLVVDVECRGGAAEGLRLGQVAGLRNARTIEDPYLTYGMGYGPLIACGDGVFVSVMADWYHCACSRIDGSVPSTQTGDVVLMAGTDYLPLTNGRRNDLRDRVLVTVSPEFAHVLPNIPNPRSPHMERLAPYMFHMVGHMRPAYLTTMKRYGIDNLIACDFARFYVEFFPEGFAGRWRPHPLLSMKQIQEYRRHVKGLGYMFGAYSDIRDWFPLNEFWDDNAVSLDPNGDLVEGWYGNFRTKPNYLPVIARLVGEKVKQYYPPDSVYMDTHTCVGTIACDFEAGVPGAGMGRDQVFFNAECILETKKYYGTVMSEGRVRWMYPGIADMDYASVFTSLPPYQLPPLVDFDLLKIHPLNLGTMMGYGPSIFFRRNNDKLGPLYSDAGAGFAPVEFYQYVSASLAYGHMLMIGYSYLPPMSRTIHLYALMQGPQKEYLPDTVAKIRYHNGREFISTGQALIADSHKLGRVRVRYSKGLTMHVNYNAEQIWQVGEYELPPFGWLIEKPGEILAFSALKDSKRVDYVRCPEYIYLNTGDAPASVEALRMQGAAWLKREGKSWRLIPCGDLGRWEQFPPPGLPAYMRDCRLGKLHPTRGCGPIAIDSQALWHKPAKTAKVTAHMASGQPRPLPAAGGARIEIVPSADVIDYTIEP